MRFSQWILLVAVLHTLPLTLACQRISGEGPMVKKQLDLDDIHSIGLGVAGSVYIQKGNNQQVEVEAQQNILDNLKTEVRNGEWEIEFENKRMGNYKDLKIYITLKEIQSLAIGGSGNITVEDPFEMDELELAIGGSGNIEISGTAKEAEISIAGSGKVAAENLKAQSCEISIAGSGDAYIEAVEQMEVSIAGSGSVYYKGRPKMSSSVAGSGRVKAME